MMRESGAMTLCPAVVLQAHIIAGLPVAPSLRCHLFVTSSSLCPRTPSNMA